MESQKGSSLPLVSGIIPCYNRPEYVAQAIESALAQTYPALEIIVVDDGSTDDTPAVLERYADRVRIVRQANAGTAAARNAGIRASSGKYLAWLDSDDTWLPEKIAAQVAVLEQFPEVGVVYTFCASMDVDGNPPPPDGPVPIPAPVIRRDILRMMVVESEIMPQSCLVRRTALDAAGWFDPAYLAEDWELNFRLAQRCVYAYLDAPLTRYRIHPNSKTGDRWPHALGLLKLRRMIESARPELLARDPSPEMRRAYKRHDAKYADICYRVGRLALQRGKTVLAREMLAEAVRRRPTVLKHHTRLWQARMTALRGSGAGRVEAR